MDSTVRITGPVFDGRAAVAVSACLEQTRHNLMAEGADMLRHFPMDKTGRARGNFQATLMEIRGPQADILRGAMITGIVWSPWLEGTSKRNQSTRFKGYHLFRLTAAWLNQIAAIAVRQELAAFLPEMGGMP